LVGPERLRGDDMSVVPVDPADSLLFCEFALRARAAAQGEPGVDKTSGVPSAVT
jgi:hypothetical protein